MKSRIIGAFVVIAALSISLWIAGGARAQRPADEPTNQDTASAVAVTTPLLLQYQGRLADPGTGEAVTDGTYTMGFRLYDVESDGTALWNEIKDVSVQGGVFNAMLGDTTSLDRSMFNGQALWLGIKVGADAEATPRQQILPVAYALSLVPGAVISTNSTAPALQVDNLGTGDALHAGGSATVDGDLTVSGGLTGGSHNHGGGDITSGTVAEARIDSAIARDNEIVSTVLANDGAGSGLDADRLDGSHASSFAPSRYTAQLSFPANALNYVSGTYIQQNHTGLLWQFHYGQAAYLHIARPADWDGTSDVEMHLYFYPAVTASGYVQFFIRPRAYSPGDTWGDDTSMEGDPVWVSTKYIIQDQVISIPASRFGSGDLWVISMQRQGSQSSYAYDVQLMSVALFYGAAR